MFKMIIFIKSKRIEVTGPSYKKQYKLTGFIALSEALNDIYKDKGLNCSSSMKVAQALFGSDNPSKYKYEGIAFNKIKNGYLIKRE